MKDILRKQKRKMLGLKHTDDLKQWTQEYRNKEIEGFTDKHSDMWKRK